MQNSILTNMTSIKIQSIFNTTQNDISTSLKRMASGVRLNQAKDGAADYVISTQMKNRLSGLNGSIDNISHGENMLLEMDRSLESILEKVNKIQTLALQASDAGYGNEERIAIQNQIDQLRSEIYREKEIATYGDKKVFEPDEIKEVKPYAYEVEYIESNGTQYIDTGFTCSKNDNYKWVMSGDFRNNSSGWTGANAYLQAQFKGDTVGSGIGQYATLTGNDTITSSYNNQTETLNVNGQNINSRSWSTYSGQNVKIGIFKLGHNNDSWHGAATIKGKLTGYQLYKDDELVLDLKPVVDNEGKVCLYDEISGKMFYNKNSGEFIAGPPVITPPPTISTTTLQVGGDAGIDNTIKLSLNVEFGILTGSVMNEADSKTLLNSAQSYMDKVLISRSQIGSALNRLETARNLQNNDIVNLNSSKSTITDTDIASESTNLAHSQILQQISTSLFSQANGINRNLALRLLTI